MIVRFLQQSDICADSGFFETLANLRKESQIDYVKMERAYHKRVAKEILTYVVVVDEKIVATTSVVFEEKFIHDAGLVAHVEDVATQEGHERNGYASMLLQKAISYARERGAYKLILDCSFENITFYVKQGLRPVEVCMRIDL